MPLATEMIGLLVEGHETVIRTSRSMFSFVDKMHDEPPADFLTQSMPNQVKMAWMLRRLLDKQ